MQLTPKGRECTSVQENKLCLKLCYILSYGPHCHECTGSTLYNCCMLWWGDGGPWPLVHPRGENGTRGKAVGAIFPRGCTNPWTPWGPCTAGNICFVIPMVTLIFLFSKFCCHLQTLLRQSIHCLVSR